MSKKEEMMIKAQDGQPYLRVTIHAADISPLRLTGQVSGREMQGWLFDTLVWIDRYDLALLLEW